MFMMSSALGGNRPAIQLETALGDFLTACASSHCCALCLSKRHCITFPRYIFSPVLMCLININTFVTQNNNKKR